ncbi:MAG: ComF family protein [Saprospiraceae bacterium]|nr:ComF family protein [Saprospiraceae bacterium]
MNTRWITELLKNSWDGCLELLYPNLCICCEGKCLTPGQKFCLECQSQLPPSEMYRYRENEFTLKFRGRVPLSLGAALFYYQKGSRLQLAMERLKYKNEPDIGISLGAYYAQLLKQNELLQNVDLLMPVPLHPSRQRIRGYNQSAMIARGFSEVSSIPVVENVLLRSKETKSQVDKNRMERIDNMHSVFSVKQAEKIENKHIALMDDILTTGATLEACALQLLKASHCRISMLTIGMTC